MFRYYKQGCRTAVSTVGSREGITLNRYVPGTYTYEGRQGLYTVIKVPPGVPGFEHGWRVAYPMVETPSTWLTLRQARESIVEMDADMPDIGPKSLYRVLKQS